MRSSYPIEVVALLMVPAMNKAEQCVRRVPRMLKITLSRVSQCLFVSETILVYLVSESHSVLSLTELIPLHSKLP